MARCRDEDHRKSVPPGNRSRRYIKRTQKSVSAVVTQALSQFLKHPLHTLFHVSTSGALLRAFFRELSQLRVLEQMAMSVWGPLTTSTSHRVWPSALC